MKIAQNVKAAWDALRGKSWVNAYLSGQEGNVPRGAELSNAYTQSAWVYACVTTIAESVAQIPFKFSTGRDRRSGLIENGPLVELFAQPHPDLNRFDFWHLVVSWLLLRGRAFIVPVNKAGLVCGANEKPSALVVLNPDNFCKIVVNHRLEGWRYSGPTYAPLESQVFLPEQIIHLRIPHPFDFWEGFGPYFVALLAAQTDYASAQFMKGLMLNNADTGVIAYTDQQMDESQRAAVQAALRERKRKAGTADRPLFLWGGVKIEKPSVSSADMEFLANRKFNRQEVCAIFKVPQELLGFTEDANRSVGESARLNFIENRIAPVCEKLEADVAAIVRRFSGGGRGGVFGFFDVASHPVMQAARRNRIDGVVKLFSVGVPLNVANEVLDVGLPKLKHGDISYLPFNVMPVGESGAPIDPADEKEESDPAEKAIRLLEQFTRSTPPIEDRANPSADAYQASIAGSINNKERKLKRFFFDQRARVLAKLERLNKSFTAEDGEGAEKRAIDDIWDQGAEDAELLARLNPLLVADLEFGGAQLWQEIGLVDFQLPPLEAMAFLKQRENRILGINDETFEALRESLEDGLASGETFAQLRERVKEVYNEASGRRAETIALTETNTAVNGGRMNGMKLAKVEKKGWQASNLENVRATHLAAERDYAKGIEIDKPFRVGGYDLMHPCDPKGPAHEVINCRCFTFAVIGEKAITPVKFLTFEEFTAKGAGERGGRKGVQAAL